jgi:hypothetical protein
MKNKFNTHAHDYFIEVPPIYRGRHLTNEKQIINR